MENDLKKGTGDLNHFTCQVPFSVAFFVNYGKISKSQESGTLNHNSLVLTLWPMPVPNMNTLCTDE